MKNRKVCELIILRHSATSLLQQNEAQNYIIYKLDVHHVFNKQVFNIRFCGQVIFLKIPVVDYPGFLK